MPKKRRRRKWYVADINCGCAGYIWARPTPFFLNGSFPRCMYCRKSLGDFSVRRIYETVAESESEALKNYESHGKLISHYHLPGTDHGQG